jgi:hypothetical protein
MIGATEITILGGGGTGAVVPAVVGVLLTSVVYGRRAWLSTGATRTPDRLPGRTEAAPETSGPETFAAHA